MPYIYESFSEYIKKFAKSVTSEKSNEIIETSKKDDEIIKLGLINIFYSKDVKRALRTKNYTDLCSKWDKNNDLKSIMELRERLWPAYEGLAKRVERLPEPDDKREILGRVKAVQDKYVICKNKLIILRSKVEVYANKFSTVSTEEKISPEIKVAKELERLCTDASKVLRDTGKWHKTYAMEIYKIVGSVNKSDINRRLKTTTKRLMHPFKNVNTDSNSKQWINATKDYLEKSDVFINDLTKLLNDFKSGGVEIDDKMASNFESDFKSGRNILEAFSREQISKGIPWSYEAMKQVWSDVKEHFTQLADEQKDSLSEAAGMFGVMDFLYEQVDKVCDKLKEVIKKQRLFTGKDIVVMGVSAALGVLGGVLTGGVALWIIEAVELAIKSCELGFAIKELVAEGSMPDSKREK